MPFAVVVASGATVCVVHSGDPEFPPSDEDVAECVEQTSRNAFRQVHGAEVIEDLDAANRLAANACLVSDRTDDVARLDAMTAPHFDAVRFHITGATM